MIKFWTDHLDTSTNYLPLCDKASVLPTRGGGGHLLFGAQCDNSSYMCLLGSHVEWLLNEPVVPVRTYATQRPSQPHCVYQNFIFSPIYFFFQYKYCYSFCYFLGGRKKDKLREKKI